MVPIIHILYSIPPTLLLYIFYGYPSLVFLIGSVLIDIDHVFWYFLKHKSLNLYQAYMYHRPGGNNEKNILHIFHTIEAWLIFFILSFFNILLWILFLGVTYHLIMDVYDMIKYNYYDVRAFSFIKWIIQKSTKFH